MEGKIIDFHTHLTGNKKSISKVMSSLAIESIVNISYPHTGYSTENIEQYESMLHVDDGLKSDQNLYYFISLPFSLISNSLEVFIEYSINKIVLELSKPNVLGVKIWKDVGMKVSYNNILIDDPIFTPIFQAIEDNNAICMVHIGDPIVAWSPLANNIEYYKNNPEYLMYEKDNVKSHTQLIDSFVNLVDRWKSITFVGAHFGSLDHDLVYLSDLLSQLPNLYVDSSGRHSSIVKNNGESFNFLLKTHPSKVLYGSDWTNSNSICEKKSISKFRLRFRELNDIIRATDLKELFFYKNASKLIEKTKL